MGRRVPTLSVGLGAVILLACCQPVEPTSDTASSRQLGAALVAVPPSPNSHLRIDDWWETVDIEHRDRKVRL